MLKHDIDLNQIRKLLKEVPDNIEVESISLTSGYELKLRHSLSDIERSSYENNLNSIISIIEQLKQDEAFSNILSNEQGE